MAYHLPWIDIRELAVPAIALVMFILFAAGFVSASETCEGYCGMKSAGGCWCDDLCKGFGDCCVDYSQYCVSPVSPSPPSTPELGPPSGSCGNGKCDAYETCNNCPADCGQCEKMPTPLLPDYCVNYGIPNDKYCDDKQEDCSSGYVEGISAPECDECATGKWKDCKTQVTQPALATMQSHGLPSYGNFSFDTASSKKLLVFSIDQGWSNGIIEKQDNVSLHRIIFNLKQFQSKYDVYALITPKNKNPSKVEAVLDVLSASNVPFILDVYGSDILTMGSDSVNAPYDVRHGLALSASQLQMYKNKYGSMFAGIRTHEVFAESFTVLACQQLGVNWCDTFQAYLPSDRFYQKPLAGQYMKFAKDNGMFLIWSDFYWAIYHPWDFDINVMRQPQNEQELRDLIASYPNTVLVTFANNEPAEGSRSKISTWQKSVQPFVQYGAGGFGLSDQSWMCQSELSPEGATYYGVNSNLLCPIPEISSWATGAFDKGAAVVQFEPVWYLWQLPKGTLGPTADYTKDPAWSNRGMPSSNLFSLGQSLGVTITNPPSASLTANVKDFGANGDGLADDAPAIQRAIDSLLPSGGIVYIPAGTYMLGTSAGGVEHFPNGNPIQSALIIRNENVTLRGDGSLTILKLMPHKKMRILSVTSKNVTLENFIADGNKAQRDGSLPWPNADVVDGLVYASSASRNVVVRNCEVRNGIEDGIGFWKSDDARVENCFSHDHGTPQAGASGISLSGGARGRAINSVSVNNTIGIWSAFGSKDVEITGNTVKNNAQEGIIIGGFTIENGKGDNSGFVIKNNHVEGNGKNGFASISIASASNGRIVGNIIVNNYYDGVQLSDDGITPTRDWTIENNTCSNTNYLRLQDFGIRILDKSNIITLRSNACENNGKSIDDQIVVSNPSAVNSDWRYVNTMSYTPLCADECTSGQKRCSGNYSQVCGNFDTDLCLEWGNAEFCSYGCSETTGTCQSAPKLSVSLTANNAYDINVNPGDIISYSWSSQNAVSAMSWYNVDGDDCAGSGVRYGLPWVANTLSDSTSTQVQPCQAGRTYWITYKVTSASGQTAEGTVIVKVSQKSQMSIAGIQGYDQDTGQYSSNEQAGKYLILYGTFEDSGNIVYVQGIAHTPAYQSKNQINIKLDPAITGGYTASVRVSNSGSESNAYSIYISEQQAASGCQPWCSIYAVDYSYGWPAVCGWGDYCSGCPSCAASPLSCAQDCSYAGQKQCEGNYAQICGNFDTDLCLEWGNAEFCSYGCSETTVTCKSAPKLSASLTANNAYDINVNPGDIIAYSWSSQNAVAATSWYNVDGDDCTGYGVRYGLPWVANTLSGSTSTQVQPCQAGRTYWITYKVADAFGKTAESTIKIFVEPGGSWSGYENTPQQYTPQQYKNSNSCNGYCGTYSPAGCWCDSYCVTAGDCCPDYYSLCGY